MKKHYFNFAALMLLTANIFAQSFFEQVPYRGAFGSEDWTRNWANWTPALTLYPGDQGYAAPAGLPENPVRVEISGDINPGAGMEVRWTANNYYVLSGLVRVLSGTLRIDPGTVIRGSITSTAAAKGTLLVAKGAKLVAVGTVQQPIVFTSGAAASAAGAAPTRSRGDWGGILLVGRASSNSPASRGYEALPGQTEATYGGSTGTDDTDSSGALRYVRIEFAGNNPSGIANSEINGLTFAGVGSRTKADFIQVSYSQDDAFEWFGGTSSHKNLIAFATTDDDFDSDEGYRGRLQFVLGVKHPAVFELTGNAASNGLEFDNNTGLNTTSQVVPNNNNPSPVTNITISNMTLVGPILAGANVTSLSTAASTTFGSGALIRTNNSSSIFNSIITGFNVLLNLNHPSATIVPSVHGKALSDSITIKNSVFGYGVRASASRFATSNIPSYASAFSIRSWIVNGPTSGITGLTGNDTSAATVGFKSGSYVGASNGVAVGSFNFAQVDYSLDAQSSYLTGASYAHPKLAQFIITGLNEASETNLVMTASPNPFSETTTISYSMVNAGNVNISVYDVRGNRISELVNGVVAAGNVSVEFDATALPKGIYFAKAVTGATVKTVKLVVK